MKYFKNIETLEQLKKEYHRLALKNHPDHGGDVEIMKEINAEYQELFAKVKSWHVNKDGETYQKDTDEQSADFINIMDVLAGLDGVTVEIIGTFIWVSGDTKPVKETLKAMGFRWSRNKFCWYLAPKGYHRWGGKTYTLDDIRGMYGTRVYKKAAKKVNRKQIATV